MKHTKQYQTKDFYLSAYLIAIGFPLVSAIKNAGLTLFEFNDSEKLNIAVTNFYAFQSSVEPITYGNSIRTLKTIIHSNANDNEQYYSQSRKSN
jgi:hypothetical protein